MTLACLLTTAVCLAAEPAAVPATPLAFRLTLDGDRSGPLAPIYASPFDDVVLRVPRDVPAASAASERKKAVPFALPAFSLGGFDFTGALPADASDDRATSLSDALSGDALGGLGFSISLGSCAR